MSPAEQAPAKKAAAKKAPAKKVPPRSESSEGFTAEERAAMKERAKEVRGKASAEADAQAVLDKIAGMPDEDRSLAEHVHRTVTEAAPELRPKLWYGMPAYARDGKIVCFFQDAAKFKARYATFGFNDPAQLDAGAMWPTTFALVRWTQTVEKDVRALVRRAVG